MIMYLSAQSLLWGSASAGVFSRAAGPSATLDSGVVIGTATTLPYAADEVNKFLGIPFAAPPERFEAPTNPPKWLNPLNTTQYKSACIQTYICKQS